MLPGYLAADYKNPLHRSEKMDRLDDVAIHEIEWYNVANDLILDQLSSRIRATAMTGSWRSVQHFQFAWASCWPPLDTIMHDQGDGRCSEAASVLSG